MVYFGTGLYLSSRHVAPTAYCTSSTTVCTSDSDCASGTCDPVTGYLEYLYAVKEPDDCWKSGGTSCSTYTDAYFLNTSSIKFTKAKAVEAGCFCAGQQMSTITCDVNGNCTGSCGTNKVCSNNTTQSCSADSQCPTGAAGLCVENKVFLKVKDASITNTGPTSPYNCTNKTDTDAITCIENNINATNGCDGGTKACKGWRRGIKGQKMFSRPLLQAGLPILHLPADISCL